MKSITRILALGALVSLPLASAMPAQAADSASVVVRFNDLNVASASGAEALYDRLHKAAWRACRDVTPSGAPGLLSRVSCARDALDSAVQKVNTPLLTALHEGKRFDLTARR